MKFLYFLLGTYCNSASACFVASDGKNLRLYQAVVDARKLLDELSDPESSVSFMWEWFESIKIKLIRVTLFSTPVLCLHLVLYNFCASPCIRSYALYLA